MSLDNIIALLAVTRDFTMLIIGVLISVSILFGISFYVNTLIEKIKGLDTAAYLAIIFLAFKFLLAPFYEISSTYTSGIIILIVVSCVAYFYIYESIKLKKQQSL